MIYIEIHHFGTMTHTPAIAILARKRLQLRIFSVVSYIVKS